ncbi:hypothetical protein Vafri_15370 [Volvox africanus]|nr:hypothetical protein Vafri_15370 [Volvox africanus]
MSSGLGQINGFLGSAGTGVREVVRSLGVQGLDAGLGCGVGIGYGFGAGLFLKPTATEQLLRQVQGTAGDITRFVQAKLEGVGLQLPGAQSLLSAPSRLRPQPSRWDAATTINHPTLQQTALPPQEGEQIPSSNIFDERHSDTAMGRPPPHASHYPGVSDAGPWAPFNGSHPHLPQPLQWQESSRPAQPQPSVLTVGKGTAPFHGQNGVASRSPLHSPTSLAAQPPPSNDAAAGSGPDPEPTAEEFRALLRHEREITRLRAQNRALRSAVCQLNRRLLICREDDNDDENGRTGLW